MTSPIIDRFEALALPEETRHALATLGWSTPTEIQAKGLAAACAGRDVLACAPTGTGKTGFFALAIISRLAGSLPRPGRPRSLVVTPTRELAIQIGEVFRQLQPTAPVAVLFGGGSIHEQDKALNRRPDLVVATPGRLLEHISRKSVRLDELRILVLDEADRLFDASFRAELKRLIGFIPETRQTLLVSATLPREMEAMARSVLNKPVRIQTGAVSPRENVREAFYELEESAKMETLLRLMVEEHASQTLIFTRTREKCDRVAAAIRRAGHEAGVLHAGIPQADRQNSLDAFRGGILPILVATDLASRGIDIPSLALVMNFDVPNTPEDYIHRTGRTGRLDRQGKAITLVSQRDLSLAATIEELVRRPITIVRAHAAPSPEADAPKPKGKRAGRGPKDAPPVEWREVERPHDLEERPYHTGKVRSPFTSGGNLRRQHIAPSDKNEEPRRSAKKRALRKLLKKRLPHQRRNRQHPSGGGDIIIELPPDGENPE